MAALTSKLFFHLPNDMIEDDLALRVEMAFPARASLIVFSTEGAVVSPCKDFAICRPTRVPSRLSMIMTLQASSARANDLSCAIGQGTTDVRFDQRILPSFSSRGKKSVSSSTFVKGAKTGGEINLGCLPKIALL
jgi:hypothetical protein